MSFRLLFVSLLAPLILGWAGNFGAQQEDGPRMTRMGRLSTDSEPVTTRPIRPIRVLSFADQHPSPSPAPTPSAEADDDEVERVEVDLASILVTAIDKERRFVTTLKAEDVRVTEDGVPQQVTIFQRETDTPVSLALLVDTSASQEGVMDDEKAAARAFVESVLRPAKDTAAVLSFTGFVRLEQPLTNELESLNTAVERLKVVYTPASPECNEDEETLTEEQILRCKTAVWDALWISVSEVLSRTPERTRRAIILLSDGDDTVSNKGRNEAVEFAVRHNVVIYSIGIRDEKFEYGELRRDDLRKVSEQTGGRAFFPKNRAELQAAFAQIDTELRSQYLVAYTTTNRRRDGSFRRVKVEIINPALRKEKLRLLYRQGYYTRAARGVDAGDMNSPNRD